MFKHRLLMNKIMSLLSLLKVKIFTGFKWYKSLYKNAPWYKKTAIGFATFLVSIILFLGAVDVNFLWLFGKSPGFSEIKNPKTSDASLVYSADGVMIGKYFNQNRTPVEYSEISPKLIHALIDTEDERFYDHHGIDIQALFAAAKDAVMGHSRGASTITQQLAKNLFRVRTQYSTGLIGKIPGVKILVMKAKEWIVALKLEMCFSKEEIITMYLNTVDFGSNAYGIKTAAKTYFGTTPAELTYEQSATLVGLLKATSYYNPRINPNNSLKRRNIVLGNMYAKGDIVIDSKKATRQQFDSLTTTGMNISEAEIENAYDGQCQYFREAVKKYLNSNEKFKEWCEDNDVDLYTAGLKIHTTIDTRMQKYAEEAAIKQMKTVQNNFRNHWGRENPWQDENHKEIPEFVEDIAKRTSVYKNLQKRFPNNPDSVEYFMNKPHAVKLFDYAGTKTEEISTMDSIRYMLRFMHCSFVAMEPQTGHVKAWVGDIDFDTWKYDKVTSQRQPGSTFKLFVYTEALNQGMTPCSKGYDAPFSMKVMDKGEEKTWAPHNANAGYLNDSISLRGAFARSLNTVAVRLGQQTGISNIIKTAHNMGIKSKLDDAPSLALGSSDVNLLELVNSYCTVINEGKTHEPILVTKIEDRDGNTIWEPETTEKQVLSKRVAFLMRTLLEGGLKEPGGTTAALWQWVHDACKDTDFGGKTGTSSNHSDAWFVGVSPNLVGGGWVGGEYRCIHFRTGQLGQGSRTALPIFGYFIQSLLADPSFAKYKGHFKPLDEEISKSCYECARYVGVEYVTDSVLVDTVIDGVATQMWKTFKRKKVQEDEENEETIEEGESTGTEVTIENTEADV